MEGTFLSTPFCFTYRYIILPLITDIRLMHKQLWRLNERYLMYYCNLVNLDKHNETYVNLGEGKFSYTNCSSVMLSSIDNYLYLRIRPKSSDSSILISEIGNLKVAYSKNPTPKELNALGALVGGLLKTEHDDPGGYAYRSMASKDFSSYDSIGFRGFDKARKGLKAAGLTEEISYSKPTCRSDPTPSKSTRIRASKKLLELAADHGVLPCDWSDHFERLPRPAAIKEPVKLRKKVPETARFGTRGEQMAFDKTDPLVVGLIRQVEEINAFFADVEIYIPDGFVHDAFCRQFNVGTATGYEWNKGGRLYSLGNSYQLCPAKRRPLITLNGEPTVEIDISASHPTIFHALIGKSFDPDIRKDVPGVPADVVKAWLNMTLGYGQYHIDWPQQICNDFLDEEKRDGKPLIDLRAEYPIATIKPLIRKKIPLIRRLRNSGRNWADFQYKESCAIVDTVHILAMEHGVPALPVHDSIIVPAFRQALAEEILSERFNHHVGVQPRLAVKAAP